MEKTLSLSIQPWSGAARTALLAAARFDTSGGLKTLEEVCTGGTLFVLADGATDEPIMHYVLRVDQHAHGKEGVIVAAAGAAPGWSLTREYLPAIEHQLAAEECLTAMCHTRRPGLKAMLEKHGYRCDAWVMRKTLVQKQ